VSENGPSPIRLDLRSLLRAPQGVDEELLQIFLKYNNVLIDRGISTFNIWMKRAHYLYNLKKYNEATNAIQEALIHDPHSADAHFLLGVCLQLMAVDEADGDLDGELPMNVRALFETAMVAFEATLELNGEDEEARSCLTNLRCLLYSPGAQQIISESAMEASSPEGDGEPDAVPVQ
jgi:tetratricopeptide (TPR) repeat protein